MTATNKRDTLRGGGATTQEPGPDLADFPDFPDDPPEPAMEQPEPPVKLEDDGTVVVRLEHPLAPHNGKGEDPLGDLTHVRIRTMFARDMLVLDEVDGDMGKVVQLAVKLTGLPTIAIERLHAKDFAKVHGVIQGRLGNFLGTSRPLWALSLV